MTGSQDERKAVSGRYIAYMLQKIVCIDDGDKAKVSELNATILTWQLRDRLRQLCHTVIYEYDVWDYNALEFMLEHTDIGSLGLCSRDLLTHQATLTRSSLPLALSTFREHLWPNYTISIGVIKVKKTLMTCWMH